MFCVERGSGEIVILTTHAPLTVGERVRVDVATCVWGGSALLDRGRVLWREPVGTGTILSECFCLREVVVAVGDALDVALGTSRLYAVIQRDQVDILSNYKVYSAKNTLLCAVDEVDGGCEVIATCEVSIF